MSTSLGKHQFFPWLRRGAGVDVDPAKTENPDGSADARAPIPVGITLHKTLAGADAGTVQASVSALLYGPGDVIGVDPRHVIRTSPTTSPGSSSTIPSSPGCSRPPRPAATGCGRGSA